MALDSFAHERSRYLQLHCCIIAALHVPYALWFYSMQWTTLMMCALVTAPLYAAAAGLLRQGHFGSGRLLYVLTANLGLFVFSLYAGRYSGIWTLYFSNMLQMLIIFGRHELRLMAGGLMLAVFCSASYELSAQDHLSTLDQATQLRLRQGLVPAVLAIFGMSAFFTFRLLGRFSAKLESTVQELRERENQLIHSSRLAAIGEIAAGLVHEVNNELNIIVGHATVLRGKADGPFKEKLQRIEACSMRIAQLMKNLRRLGRSENEDHLTWILADKAALAAVDLCRGRARKGDVKLELDVPADIRFQAREAELGQALLNLLTNAVEAAEKLPERWVRISARKEGEDVAFRIVDSGCIAPEQRMRTLQPFYTTKNSAKGAGLGLSVVRGVAIEHNGRFQLDALAPNTTFVLRLPLSQERRKQAA